MEAPGAGATSGAGAVVRCASASSRTERIRARLGVFLLLLGLVVASVPGLAAGDSFRPCASVWSRTAVLSFPAWSATSPGATPAVLRITGDNVSVTSSGRTVTIRATGSITVAGWPLGRSSLVDSVLHEPGWTAAAIALLSMVPFFAWWRRGGLSFGRVAGIATCAAAAAAVCVFVLAPGTDEPRGSGIWWTVPLGAVLTGAAFVVAPAAERRGDE